MKEDISKVLQIQTLREQGQIISTQRVESMEDFICEQIDLERDCQDLNESDIQTRELQNYLLVREIK